MATGRLLLSGWNDVPLPVFTVGLMYVVALPVYGNVAVRKRRRRGERRRSWKRARRAKLNLEGVVMMMKVDVSFL